MTTWIGTVHAAGFVFDESLVTREELLTRLLALWSDGARLGRSGTRWFLVGLSPRRVDSRSAPGTPLAWVEGRWLSAPHSEADVRAAPLDSVLDLHGGTTHVHRFSSLEAVHPVDLMALERPRVLNVTLLEPPPRPVIAPPKTAPTSLDQVFKSMLQSLDEAPRNELVVVPPAPAPRASPIVRLRSWLAGVAARRAERAQAAAREREQQNAARAERERAERAARLERERAEQFARIQRVAQEQAAREERERLAGPSLWSRLTNWLGSGAQTDARRNDTDVQQNDTTRDGDTTPGPWSRFTRWLGADAQQGPTTQQRGAGEGNAPPGLWSRFTAWLGAPPELPPPTQEQAVNQLRDELNRPPQQEPLDPSVWERLARWLAPAAGNAEPQAREPGLFNRLLSRQGPEAQKNYLDDLRRRFLEGDLAEALRRAVPLGGTGVAGPPTGVIPPRRSELSLLAPNARGAPSMVMPDSEYEQMRKLYREAADKLIAEGRIEEAAYLLARLLNDAQAGVALLEKHGKLELAAQLATVQHLPEIERIRLWLLAGRTEEAIRVVRGSRDFAALINALSGKAPELARQLRAVWGEYLANHDRYTEAIVATAPLAEPPNAFPQWVDRAFETGGANAATALAVDLGRYPDHAPAARQRLDELLANDENSTLTATTATLLATHAPKAPPPLYRDLWRRLMHGASQQHRAVERQVTDSVLRLSGDAALQADAVIPNTPAWRPDAPLREIPAPVVAGLPLFDVADLPKGRRAFAEGAAGLRVVSRDGKTVRQHLVKADALVVGPIGTQVLVISRDGQLTRVWKLHPRTLELTSWFQATLDCFAPRYDGIVWPVGMEHSLVLLDPSTPLPMEWWRVPATHCRELDLTGSHPHVIALAKDVGTNQTWRMVYDVGAQKLERRLGSEQSAFQNAAQLQSWEVRVAENGATVLHLIESKVNVPLAVGARTFLATKAGMVMTWVTNEACSVSLIDWRSGALRTTVRLSRVRQPVLRELSDGVVVCDEFGRVTAL